MDDLIFNLGAVALVAFGLWHSWRTAKRQELRDRERLAESKKRGLHLPMSLHPRIDPAICIGSGACVSACPEGRVIGLIEGCGHLVAGSHCVGHGLCARACPVGAISLVFGSAKRGVELPEVSGDFESSVSGLYIAGELGGMGLIANAVEQAIQAVDHIADALHRNGRAEPGVVDLAIVGAGPAGLAAALRAKERELSYVCLEQERVGGAIRSYPRQKIVMTRPVRVPLFGPVKLRKTTKEALLALWQEIIATTKITIEEQARVDDIQRMEGDGPFTLLTSRGERRARRVILAMGRRGTPRKLGVPGEEGTNVTTHLMEAERWAGQKVVVVGGGDTACEAALTLLEQRNTRVLLVHRAELNRPRAELRERLEAADDGERLSLWLNTELRRIEDGAVTLDRGGDSTRVCCDRVLICIGGMAPTAFLSKIGVTMTVKFGDA